MTEHEWAVEYRQDFSLGAVKSETVGAEMAESGKASEGRAKHAKVSATQFLLISVDTDRKRASWIEIVLSTTYVIMIGVAGLRQERGFSPFREYKCH